MSVFVCAAETGSLSSAARRLAIPLPTVSRKVAELERHLKASLLVRTRAGLELTEAGQGYLVSARAILDELAAAERSAAGEYSEPSGKLVITSPLAFGRLHVLPVVTEFLAAFPQIDVNLVQSDRLSHLAGEHIDCAVRIGDLPDSDLTGLRLGDVRRVVCASPNYLARHAALNSPTDLEHHDCLAAVAFGTPERWDFRSGKSKVAAMIRSRLTINTVEGAVDAAVAGAGLTRALSYQVEAQVKRGELVIVLEAFEPPPWTVHLLYKPLPYMPKKLRAYLDFSAPRLRQRLADAMIHSPKR